MLGIIDFLFTIFELLIFARVLMSWFRPDPYNQIVQFINQATEPFLAPIRQFTSQYMPADMPLDFSPMIALILAYILQTLIHSLFRY